jgi:hypothetical protein
VAPAQIPFSYSSDICLFINNEQQSVNDADCSKYVSELLSECVPPILHHLAEFKDHPYE